MQYKAVIYDCDGVMFDSFDANVAFYDRIMAMMGNPALDRGDDEQMRIMHTYANREVLRYFFPDELTWSEAVRAASRIDYRDLVKDPGLLRLVPDFSILTETIMKLFFYGVVPRSPEQPRQRGRSGRK